MFHNLKKKNSEQPIIRLDLKDNEKTESSSLNLIDLLQFFSVPSASLKNLQVFKSNILKYFIFLILDKSVFSQYFQEKYKKTSVAGI